MHAVLVKVSISDVEDSVKELRETVVPRISQSPGFVAGYWTRSEDGSNGRSMIVFESEENAQAAAGKRCSSPVAGSKASTAWMDSRTSTP